MWCLLRVVSLPCSVPSVWCLLRVVSSVCMFCFLVVFSCVCFLYVFVPLYVRHSVCIFFPYVYPSMLMSFLCVSPFMRLLLPMLIVWIRTPQITSWCDRSVRYWKGRVRTLMEKLLNFLSRSDGGSCPNKNKIGGRNAISIYIPVANSFPPERAFFGAKLLFRDQIPDQPRPCSFSF